MTPAQQGSLLGKEPVPATHSVTAMTDVEREPAQRPNGPPQEREGRRPTREAVVTAPRPREQTGEGGGRSGHACTTAPHGSRTSPEAGRCEPRHLCLGRDRVARAAPASSRRGGRQTAAGGGQAQPFLAASPAGVCVAVGSGVCRAACQPARGTSIQLGWRRLHCTPRQSDTAQRPIPTGIAILYFFRRTWSAD